MELLINIANLLYILTYFIQDLLRIRFLTLGGSAMLVVYFSLQPEPVLALIYWNVFFILLNLFQLARLVVQQRTGTDPFGSLASRISSEIRRLAGALRLD